MRDDVRALLWLPPGPQLAAALTTLHPAGPCPLPHDAERMLELPTPGHAPGWPCACQVIIAAAWAACSGWAAARAAASLTQAAGDHPVTLQASGGARQISEPARDELAAALRNTPTSMGNRICAARDLATRPQLLALAESGAITPWAARLIAEQLHDLDPEQCHAVLTEVDTKIRARLASGRRAYHSAEVSRLTRAARLRICPETDAQTRVRSFAARRVTVHPQPGGMATLIADLAETDAHRIYRRLTAIATALAHDTPDHRTRDQLRADVLADLLLATPTPPDPPTSPPATNPGGQPSPLDSSPPATSPLDSSPPATSPPDSSPPAASPPATSPDIHVIISLPTLLGLAHDPAEIPGLGPIPADLARTLAADAAWTAWITDTTGTITTTSSRSYTPSPSLARLIRARLPHCRFPGCRQPAINCDLDHATPWPHGATDASNLGPLCRRHHNLKTHAGWTLTTTNAPDQPPTWQWHAPSGLDIPDQPEPPLP
jgi:hypothetical protein